MKKINVMALLKFGKEENIKNLLLNGEIYMNTINTFMNMDRIGMGDKYEGMFEVKNYKNVNLKFNIPNNPISVTSPQMQLRKNYKGHIGNIYSTYAVSNNLLERKSQHRIDKRMLIFGSHCLIIKDVKQFTDKIFKKLNEQNYNYQHGLIKYKNFNIDNSNLSSFNKTHLLSYQKEHRILVNTEKNEILKFEIGSLEAFAEMHPSNRLIDTFLLEYNQ